MKNLYKTQQELIDNKIRVFVTQKTAGDFGFEIFTPNPNKEKVVGIPWIRHSYFTQHFPTYNEALEAGINESKTLEKYE